MAKPETSGAVGEENSGKLESLGESATAASSKHENQRIGGERRSAGGA